MQTKKSTLFKYNAILVMLAAALLASCENLISRAPNDAVWGGYEQGENSARGALTVTARVSNGSSRHAMPSIPDLVYAALLYKDGEIPANPESKDFAQGTAAENGKLIFSFQRPDDTSGTFTLEIFAFVKTEGESTPQFSRGAALLSGGEGGLAIDGEKIVIDKAIPLSSKKSGTVSLKIKVPEGCLLEIDDARFAVTGDSPVFTLTQAGDGISAGAYPLTFTVKKGSEIVHIFSEYINVINGLCTDTWSGLEKGAAKDIANSISKTVYVRGTGGWYETSPYNATANDANSGSFLSPFATIQKAVDTIIARKIADLESNDGEPVESYTICVDGTLDGTTAERLGTYGMADFSKLDKNLTLTIKALSGTATLDGGARFDADGNVTKEGIKKCVIYAKPASGTLNLTLENLVITGGYRQYANGGGIYIGANSEVTISGDTMISKNIATYTPILGGRGGGVYVSSGGKLIMEDGTISENKVLGSFSKIGGGGVYLDEGTFEMSGGTISGNSAEKNGGGVYVNGGTLNMSDEAKIAESDDVYLYNGATITVAGDLTAESPVATITPSAYAAGMQVLSLASGAATTLAANCGKFEVSEAGWKIDEEGKLAPSPDVYVSEGGDDTSGKGSQAKPFATLQKAVDTAIARNDGAGAYTIFVDGTLTQSAAPSGEGMADFSALDKNLTLTIKALSGTATLDANTLSRVINAKPASGALNLMLENLVITGGNASDNGGGIYFGSTGGTLTISDGTTISGNTATGNGGGIYFNGATLTMTGSASIPAGNEGKNDVYLAEGKTITVAGALTAATPVATITLDTYKTIRQVLSADVTITQDLCDKFALSEEGWQILPKPSDSTAGVLVSADTSTIYLNSSSGDDANFGLSASNAVKTLSKAIELFDAYNSEKIMVCYQYNLPSDESGLLDRAGKSKLTLMRYDGSSEVSGAWTNLLFRINSSSGNVTITNVTLDGNKDNVTAISVLLSIESGNVTLGDGATICNNRNGAGSGSSGGAIYMQGSGTTVKMMDGAKITGNESTNNDCGGIYVNNGTFEMSGGTISGNTAGKNGGGVYVSGGTFTMSDGTISGNTAGKNGGGVYVGYTATFTISGGKITGNTAGTSKNGVYVNGTFTNIGGTVQSD